MEALALWNEADPVILSTAAQYSIKSDPKKRCDLFEASLREIKIMLYQVQCDHPWRSSLVLFLARLDLTS